MLNMAADSRKNIQGKTHMDANQAQSFPRTSVSFRIFAPGLLPEDVTRNLQIIPDHIHHQGDYPINNPKASVYRHGMWLINSKLSEDQPLEVHLDNLLSLLEPQRSYIYSLAQQVTVDFSCYLYFQDGFQLSSQILKRIGELGAAFDVVLLD